MGRVRRIVAFSAFGVTLAGCGSGSVTELFPAMASSTPAKATVQLQSQPAGAEAKTSAGSSCQTPCSLELAANGDMSVTLSLDGYQSQTIPVKQAAPTGRVEPGAYPPVVFTPNSVFAQLEPIKPAAPTKKKPKQPKHVAAAKPRPAAAQPAPQPGAPEQPQPPMTQ